MASPPWPHMDTQSALFALLQEDHHRRLLHHQMQAPPSLAASRSSSSPSPSQAPVAKPGKRKSRALGKPPIRVLSADKESFRDMVQKLTGIPSSPHITLQAGMQPLLPSAAARQSSSYASPFTEKAAPAFKHPTMPTLDTSSAYLSRGRLSPGASSFSNEAGKRPRSDFYEVGYVREEVSSAAMVSGSTSYEEGFGPQASDGSSELERFLMSSSKVEDLVKARIDPWLTPYVEISHSS